MIKGYKKFPSAPCKSCKMEYERMIEFFTDPVLIVQDLSIMAANRAAKSFLGQFKGKSLTDYLKDQSDTAAYRISRVLETKRSAEGFDYKIYRLDETAIYAELTTHYIDYNCKPAVLICCKDITFQKFDLLNASWIQRMNLMKRRPSIEGAIIRTVYVPARTVSGDFFFFQEVEGNKLIGVLGDVRGKGINAALKISAFEVLFREIVNSHSDLVAITDKLNEKIMAYMEEYYIAALMFCIDRENDIIEMIGAGMGEFFLVNNYGEVTQELLKGPFLGMFQNIGFEYRKYRMAQVKRLFLYSDGIEALMQNGLINPEYFFEDTVFNLANTVQEQIENQSISLEGIPDDCTMIFFDFSFKSEFKEYVLYGINQLQSTIDDIIQDIDWVERHFEIRLILSELLVNAYRYGNLKDPDLPITVTILNTAQGLLLEVLDMGYKAKKKEIVDTIRDEDLLNENGRGMFIVNELADRLTIGAKSIIVELFK